MFAVNINTVNRDEVKKAAAYDLGILDAAKTSRMRTYNRLELKDDIAEQQKAESFNAQIKDNYKKLLNFKPQTEIEEALPQNEFANIQPQSYTKIAEDEETLPSKTTMQFINMEKDEFELKNSKTAEKQRLQLSTKAKLAIVMYTAIVVFLLVLIVLNTKALSTLGSDIEYMTASVRTLSQENAATQSNLEGVLSYDNIAYYAKETLGMVQGK